MPRHTSFLLSRGARLSGPALSQALAGLFLPSHLGCGPAVLVAGGVGSRVSEGWGESRNAAPAAPPPPPPPPPPPSPSGSGTYHLVLAVDSDAEVDESSELDKVRAFGTFTTQ